MIEILESNIDGENENIFNIHNLLEILKAIFLFNECN